VFPSIFHYTISYFMMYFLCFSKPEMLSVKSRSNIHGTIPSQPCEILASNMCLHPEPKYYRSAWPRIETSHNCK